MIKVRAYNAHNEKRASRTASILLDTAWKAVIGRLEPYQSPKTVKKQLYKPESI